MFDVDLCEKAIAFNLLKREIALKGLTVEKAAEKLDMDLDLFKNIIGSECKYYTYITIIFWAECIARNVTTEEILDSFLERKASTAPHDPFYNEIWQLMANVEADLQIDEDDKIKEK